MIFFSDRKKIADAYEEWLKENPTIEDCSFNLVTFMVGEGLVKDKTETDFYNKIQKNDM